MSKELLESEASLSDQGFEMHYLPLRVNEKILLHLGAGSYRSVAEVIKELVNNAFDADAEQVVISIHSSNPDEIRVFDTGVGMSLERFKMALVSIGNSLKDSIDQRRVTKKYRRPIIGRFGIGLIGLSQICDRVMIQSQEPDATSKFLALIDFTPLRQNGLERSSLSVLSSRDGGIELLRRQLFDTELEPERREELALRLKLAKLADEVRQDKGFEVENQHLGHCWFVPELPALPLTEGTSVSLLGIRPEIKQFLHESDPDEDQEEEEHESFEGWRWSWAELCEKMRRETDGLTYQALPNYHQFLYELALMTPVPYFDHGPISSQPEILAEKKEQLKRFNFSVSVDNRTLYKPILLPSGSEALNDKQDAPAEAHLITPLHFNQNVPASGSRLRYHGYLYWQKRQNKPSPIRGIQIYIRNVAIGLYDETLLNFAKMYDLTFAQTGQISGEIYVEEGLEQALNVDRRSFRETDPHYLMLKQAIFQELEAILQKSIEADKRREKVKAGHARQDHLAQLSTLVSRAANGKLNLTTTTNGATHPVEVHQNSLVFDLESEKWAGTKSERLLGQKILLTMRAAAATGASTQDTLTLVEDLLLK